MSASDDPASGFINITPSDSANVSVPNNSPMGIRAFTVNVAGDVAVVCQDGSTGTLTVIAGYVYPLRIIRVLATGTTATGIKGWL